MLNRTHKHLRSGLTALGLGAALSSAHAAISVSSSDQVYTQNFDTLVSQSVGSWTDDSTLPGWFSSRSAISSTPRNPGYPLVSYGSGTIPERALGFSGYASENTVGFGLHLVNDSGSVLHSVTVSFYGEKWYANLNPDAYTGGLEFSFGTSSSESSFGVATTRMFGLDFDPPGNVVEGSAGNLFLYGDNYYLLDGNHGDYRTLISQTFFIAGGWAPGENLVLAWRAGVWDADGASDGLAIDDLVVSFGTTPIPEPAAFTTLLGAGVLGAACTRRRRR